MYVLVCPNCHSHRVEFHHVMLECEDCQELTTFENMAYMDSIYIVED